MVGTVGVSPAIDAAIAQGLLDVSALDDGDGALRWEGFVLQATDQTLYIAGADRRGTDPENGQLAEEMGIVVGASHLSEDTLVAGLETFYEPMSAVFHAPCLGDRRGGRATSGQPAAEHVVDRDRASVDLPGTMVDEHDVQHDDRDLPAAPGPQLSGQVVADVPEHLDRVEHPLPGTGRDKVRTVEDVAHRTDRDSGMARDLLYPGGCRHRLATHSRTWNVQRCEYVTIEQNVGNS